MPDSAGFSSWNGHRPYSSVSSTSRFCSSSSSARGAADELPALLPEPARRAARVAREGRGAARRFEGDGIKWFGRKFDGAGRSRVTIDGKEVAVVDQYALTRDEPFEWEHNGLGASEHVIRVEITGERHQDSKNTRVNLIGFGSAGSKQPDVGFPAPQFDARRLDVQLVKMKATADAPGHVVAVEVTDGTGKPVRPIDLGSGGATRRPYVSWLPMANAKPTPFCRTTALRSGRQSQPRRGVRV